MAGRTKERILETAIDLFSRRGYAGTSMNDIAQALGLTKAALYKHYPGKEEIWSAAFRMMESYYNEHFGSVDKLPMIPGNPEELRRMTLQMLNFTLHDENVRKMRRIIHTEQFRSEAVRDMANNYFLYDTKAIFTKVFEKMMENGSMKRDDPEMLALAYTAPVTALIHLCDREPEKEEEALQTVLRYVTHFTDTYCAGK